MLINNIRKAYTLTSTTVNMFYYFHWAVLLYTLTYHFDTTGLLITSLSYFCFACLGIEVNAHRYFAHRSFKYRYKWMEYVFSWFTCLAGTGGPMQWVGIHFNHHNHADEEGDPHNPHTRGLWMFAWLIYEKGNPLNLKHMINPYQKWLVKNYFFVYLITWGVLWLIGGFWLVAYAAMVPTAITTLVQIGTTYFCHLDIGYRNHDIKDKSTNIWWWSLIDFGDGLHNNHHANPGKWNLREKWFEIDISGLVIKYVLRKNEPSNIKKI